MLSMQRILCSLALSSALLCIPTACWVQTGVQAAWEPRSPTGYMTRGSGEPLNLLMTNNDSYDSEYHYEGMSLRLPHQLKLGAIVEATVINHANSNYPVIPSLEGYFEYLTEYPSDVETVTISNDIWGSRSKVILYPNGTYVIVARKYSMTHTGCSDCIIFEELHVRMLREDDNIPWTHPPNTTVYATCILKVLDPGKDVNIIAEFFSNPIVQVVCAIVLIYVSIRTGIRKERHRHRRAALEGVTVDGATIVASSQMGYCAACGSVLQSEDGSCSKCDAKGTSIGDDESV